MPAIGITRDILAIDAEELDTAAVTGAGQVAADHIAVDRDAAAARREQQSGVVGHQARLAGDEDAATGGGAGLGEGLVEQDHVVRDHAVVRQTQVTDTSAAAGAEVTADPVLLHGVLIGTGVQRQTTARTATAAVPGDVVVVDADEVVLGIGVEVGVTLLRDQLRVANTDTAAEGTGIAGDAVVADLEVLGVAVDHDAAAGAGTDDAEAVDTGAAVLRIAEALVAGTLAGHEDAGALFGREHRLGQRREAGDSQPPGRAADRSDRRRPSCATLVRQLATFSVGTWRALMVTAPAPQPWSLTGFHMTTSSSYWVPSALGPTRIMSPATGRVDGALDGGEVTRHTPDSFGCWVLPTCRVTPIGDSVPSVLVTTTW